MKRSLTFRLAILLFTAGITWIAVPSAGAIDDNAVTQLASKVHTDLRNQVLVQKMNISKAIVQQKEFLLKNLDVKEVRQLKGNNLFVLFKDGNELLMFLGTDRMGTETDSIQLAQQTAQQVTKEIQKPVIDKNIVPLIKLCTLNSNKALIFDCLDDDYNVVSPKISQQVKTDLEAMGYTVTSRLNNDASLANAALMDDGEYGVVLMRGHGGDLGGDFGFLVRPWYTSYPPANSGYTGTIRASAYNHAAGATQFGYVITGTFSSTYWTNKSFPGTFFFLESCHGADPGALPGMPTWTTNHGAKVWLGWNESVSFNCGDNGTKLFFQKVKVGKSVGEAVTAVYNTGCRPPELVSFPAGRGYCRFAVWKSDPNEKAVPDNRDFKLLRLVSDKTQLHSLICFYDKPSFDEFFFYIDADGVKGADVLVKCHPKNIEVYKPSKPGLYNIKVYTGPAVISGNSYSFSIPWDKAPLGGGTKLVAIKLKVWLYDMTGKDRLPDSGEVVLTK